MSIPVAPLDICNLALDQLKQAPINSIDSPRSDTEFVMKRNYDPTRRECLRKHPWKFATKREILTPDATAPVFGYSKAYNLPNDYIRLVMLGDDFADEIRNQYEDENGQLVLDSGTAADSTSLQMRYVFDNIEVTKWDPLFVKFCYLQLAVNVSNKFSVSPTTKRELKADLADIDNQARAVNGQDKAPKRIQRSAILDKRRGLPGGLSASKFTVFP